MAGLPFAVLPHIKQGCATADDIQGVLCLDLGPERAIGALPAEQPSQAPQHSRLGSGDGRVGHRGLHMSEYTLGGIWSQVALDPVPLYKPPEGVPISPLKRPCLAQAARTPSKNAVGARISPRPYSLRLT